MSAVYGAAMNRREAMIGGAAAAGAVALGAPGAGANLMLGKTVNIVVPFPAGSGPDEWARHLAPLLGRHLPGAPTFLIKNHPGGGSVAGANLFAATAKPDGLSLLVTAPGTLFPYLLGEARVMYEFHDWTPVVVAPGGGVAYVSARTGVKSGDDLKAIRGQKLYYASQGVTSIDLVPLLAFHQLGLNVQHVTGFSGRSDARLAFERGETNIDTQPMSAYLHGKRTDAVPLFTWGVLHEDKIVRDAHAGELPHIAEICERLNGRKPEGAEWEALRAFVLAGFQSQRMLLVPRATPKPVLQAWREAAVAALRDPEYVGRREPLTGDYDLAVGEAADMLFRNGTHVSPAAREWVRGYLSKHHNVSFDRGYIQAPTP